MYVGSEGEIPTKEEAVSIDSSIDSWYFHIQMRYAWALDHRGLPKYYFTFSHLLLLKVLENIFFEFVLFSYLKQNKRKIMGFFKKINGSILSKKQTAGNEKKGTGARFAPKYNKDYNQKHNFKASSVFSLK